jgi:hypothetical protein
MDVIFCGEVPYYKEKGDLDPFMKISSVIESDSREWESENGVVQNDGVTHEKVVVETIPCPINENVGLRDLASEASGGVVAGGVEQDEAFRGVSGDHDDQNIDI